MRNANERSAKLIISALHDLTAAVKSLRDEQIRATSKAEISKLDTHVTELVNALTDIRSRFDSVTASNATDSSKTHTFYRRSLIVQWFLFAATAAAFGAAAYYACVAKLQKDTMEAQWRTMHDTWVEMQKQTAAIQTSAEAAKKAAQLSFMEAEGTQGAIITLGHVFQNNQLHYDLYNGGHSTAQNVTARLSLTRRSWPDKKALGLPRTFVIEKQPLPAGKNLIGREVSSVFSQPEWDAISRAQQFVQLSWVYSWDNGFGRTYTEQNTVCIAYEGTQVKIGNTGRGPSGPIELPCDREFDETMVRFIKFRDDAIAERDGQGKPKR